MAEKKIKLLRTALGEDVIAEVLAMTDDVIRLKNAVRVVVMPQKTAQQGISVGFAPWLEFSEDVDISVDRSHIVAIMTPIKMLTSQYNSMFSGIITPSGSSLLLPG
jgi:hypothetical protein